MSEDKTPNLELNLPEKEDKNWDVPTNANWNIVDGVVGKVSDVGNYSVVRNNLVKLLGLETGLGDKSIIKAINDVSAIIGNKSQLKDNDAFGSRTLKEATDVVDAINMLDAVWYEEIELEATSITISPTGQGVIIGAGGIAVGTPLGAGVLRWKQARNAFGFQAYGQGGEGSEVNVTGNVNNLLVRGQGGVGGIYINVVFASLPVVDTEFTVTAVCRIVDLEHNVGNWDGDKLLVLKDDNGWKYSFTPTAGYEVSTVVVANSDTATPNAPLVETYEAGGFVSASGTVEVWYCVEDSQDTATSAFWGFMTSRMLAEVTGGGVIISIKNNVYVATNGSDVDGTGSIINPVATIAKAKTLIPSGEAGVIYLGAGTFVGSNLDNIGLVGADSNVSVVTGNFTMGQTDSCFIRNITFKGTITLESDTGIRDILGLEGGRIISNGGIHRASGLYIVNTENNSPVLMNDGDLFAEDVFLFCFDAECVDNEGTGNLVILNGSVANNSDSATIYSAGEVFLANLVVTNSGSGSVINIDNGVVSPPNVLNGILATGNIVCGDAVTHYEGLVFVSGALSGTNAVTHTHGEFNGTKAWTGDLDMGGNDINNVGSINPTSPLIVGKQFDAASEDVEIQFGGTNGKKLKWDTGDGRFSTDGEDLEVETLVVAAIPGFATELYVDGAVSDLEQEITDEDYATDDWSPTGWETTTLTATVNDLAHMTESLNLTGRITPEDMVIDGDVAGNTITVLAGEGYIVRESFHVHFSWTQTEIDTTGYSEGAYYLYINQSGSLMIAETRPSTADNIYLGIFTHSGVSISGYSSSGRIVKTFGSRLFNYLRDLGAFFVDDCGGLLVDSVESQAVVTSQCGVRRGLLLNVLPEVVSKEDYGDSAFAAFTESTGAFFRDRYWLASWGDAGIVPTDRWNDITKEHNVLITDGGATPVVVDLVFTNGSNQVTCVGVDITGEVEAGDMVWLDADGEDYITRVQGVALIGPDTVITLNVNYEGTGGTGEAKISHALPNLTGGKWVKHLVVRGLDAKGTMYLIYGQAQYDTEEEAIEAALPTYSDNLRTYGVKLAEIVVQAGDVDLTGKIYDLRPVPFWLQRTGGAAVGGGGGATNHGDLLGLANDDHLQYLRADATRNITGEQKYASDITISDNKGLTHKKYVDDADVATLGSANVVAAGYVSAHDALGVAAHGGVVGTSGNQSVGGIKAFTSIPVAPDSDPVANNQLSRKSYVDGVGSGAQSAAEATASGYVSTHAGLTATHGATGAVVGTTNTQTLTNKTLTSPVIGNFTNAQHDHSNVVNGGLIAVQPVEYAEAEAETNTASLTYEDKTTLTFTAVAGTYVVEWYAEIANSNDDRAVGLLLELDGVTTLAEPQENARRKETWYSANGVARTVLTGAAHTFKIRYKAIANTAYIRRARIVVRRVA